MGTIRTVLALTVVVVHSYGTSFVGGQNAVQLFYMISGFLISYVLVEKRSYAIAGHFYVSRYLRLLPIYLVVAATGLALRLVAAAMGQDSGLFSTFRDAPWSAKIFLLFSNVTLLGIDWTYFLGVKNGALVPVSHFLHTDVDLQRGLLIFPAWTLGVELSFYLIAPFILYRRWLVWLLLGASLAVRAALLSIGLGAEDPWNYRFFPSELALFLIGALAHQILLPLYRQVFTASALTSGGKVATAGFVILCLFYGLLPGTSLVKSVLLMTAFVALLPLVFEFQRASVWDQRLGELSYPIYISHIVVVYLMVFLAPRLGLNGKFWFSFGVVVATLLVSLALNRFVAAPMEGFRHRLRRVET